MRDKDLYARILGIKAPWRVAEVTLKAKDEEVHIVVEPPSGAQLRCPECEQPVPGYDKRRRRWRHLDTCQFHTIVEADVPRTSCPEHGVLSVTVPWAEPGSGFTALFEALVIDWLGDAVDKVRRGEHRALLREGITTLTGTKYNWLENPHTMSRKHRQALNALRYSSLKTARAWTIKEFGMNLWHYVSRTWARKGWLRWYAWAIRSRLEPMKKVARTIKAHLWGILNAVVLKANNGAAEGINSRIKMVKHRSRGFRSKARFANAIYSHLGGFDLYPEGVK